MKIDLKALKTSNLLSNNINRNIFYRLPEYSNLTTFFDEITTNLSKALLKYENIILMGDFNIDTKCKDIETDKLEELCDVFNLKNLVKSETCFTKDNKSLIDLILTNKPLSFQRTQVTETGLSDYHKLITTFFKCKSQRLKPKIISYWKYESFNESAFLNDVAKLKFELGSKNPHEG